MSCILFTIFFIVWLGAQTTNLNPTTCDDGYHFGWSKNVVSSMWIMSSLVPTCNVNGYGEFGNCLTLKYTLISHYSKRWLLTSNLYIQIRGLCLFVANNTNYIECDYTRHVTCMCGRCYLLMCCCWKVWMVKHGKMTCVNVTHVIFLM